MLSGTGGALRDAVGKGGMRRDDCEPMANLPDYRQVLWMRRQRVLRRLLVKYRASGKIDNKARTVTLSGSFLSRGEARDRLFEQSG